MYYLYNFFFLLNFSFTVFTILFRGTRRAWRTLRYPDRTYADRETSIVEFSANGHSNIDRSTETSTNHETNLVQ